MAQLFKNNVSGVLSAQLSAIGISMTLVDASNFPDPATDFYSVTLVGLNSNGQEDTWEVVNVTSKASNTLSITRAQEGTTALLWPAATTVQMRLTAGFATEIESHTNSSSNPHAVTKTQVGLGNVDNTNDSDKPVSTAQQNALNLKANIASPTFTGTVGGITAAMVGAPTGTGTSTGNNTGDQDLSGKQNVLVSGTNIKTINGQSLLGGGDVALASTSLSGNTTIHVGQVIDYTITNYNSFSEYVVQVTAGSVSLTGDTISFTAPGTAQAVTLTVITDGVPTAFALDVLAAGVATPSNATPTNGATNQNGTVTLTSSAFLWLGLADTHLNSDWQLATDAGFTTVVQSTTADASNKTSWTVSGLVVSQTYYWRVRHQGNANGTSSWSVGTSFVTKANFSGLIGVSGTQGFGVGECPTASWLTTLALTAMTGTSDKAHENYGNYQHTNGGISVFIPKFYYKYGDTADSAYATYGANTLSIRGIETFSGEAAANVAGYALHRAFIDNNIEQVGFFVDKYLASKDGTSSCKSVALGVPISLATSTSYTNSNGMTGCTGILADAVVLARARGTNWNSELIFQRDAVAKLTQAHAQHATGATYCAWYDAAGTTNFPKGCNNGALADTNDATVTFISAGDAGTTAKPKTGSASNLAKTTHNGQTCGIADVNGSMYQALLGLTQAGVSATDTAANTTGTAFVLKRSAKHSALTGGFGAATDAWGTAANLATNYDSITGFLPWLATTGQNYFGNGANQVFSGATTGTDYLRSCCGIGALTGMSATGTSQFGSDGNYQYGRANLFPLASGNWNNAGSAGVFYRNWSYIRSNGGSSVGFRASAYGN